MNLTLLMPCPSSCWGATLTAGVSKASTAFLSQKGRQGAGEADGSPERTQEVREPKPQLERLLSAWLFRSK